ncbi:MAG: hypothetical protein CBB66_06320 [bacterium TMED6]|nr:MAG: hypothetical protein CBB66_06320 [bacterium TMED6]
MEKINNFANAIKQLRKSKGITLDQISDSCKIKKSYFEKMESGDFSFKPNVYIKLFLKEYLKYIDFEKSENIMQEFDSVSNINPIDIDLTFMPLTDEEDLNYNNEDNSLESKDYDPKQIATIIGVIIIIIFTYRIISTLVS